MSAEDRFWAKVEKSDSCWTWAACTLKGGYGHFRADSRRLVLAHRFAWELHNGPVPKGLHVLHKCDNPACVRHDHLFVGTHTENMRDMVNKGRGRSELTENQSGAANNQSKITEKVVTKIRKLRSSGMLLRDIADRFGICFQNVSLIANRKTWVHIP